MLTTLALILRHFLLSYMSPATKDMLETREAADLLIEGRSISFILFVDYCWRPRVLDQITLNNVVLGLQT